MANAAVLGIAHRGASGYAPENTVAAIDEAIRLGALAVEFDVRLCADGIPVVLHDSTVDRTTNGKGAVCDLTRLSLLRLDAGSWKHPRFAGTRIPTVDEALRAIDEQAIPVLELKTPLDPALLETLLRDNDALGRAVLLSFDPEILAAMRRRMPTVTLGLLGNSWRPDLPLRCRQLDARILAMNLTALTLERVEKAGKENRRCWCYTANDAGTVAACAAMGVQGIITDFPDLIRSRKRPG